MVNLQTRVVNILTKPAVEWPVIAAEPTDVATLYKQYIAPLAAIPAVCSFIGQVVFGVSFLGYTYRTPVVRGLTTAIVSYVMALVSAYVCALIIQNLAPRFKSSGTLIDALKLVAYASTAAWVAGILNILPALSVLGILAGLYSIYLFYLGLPVMMKTPEDQVVPYMVVSAVVVIVVTLIGVALSAAFARPTFPI
jgi:hypothetical protein